MQKKGKFYKLHDLDGGEEAFYIEIIEGPFAGVKFQYGQIQFMGEDAQGNGMFNFGYTFRDDTRPIVDEQHLDSLHAVMGQILHDILQEMAAQAQPE